MARRIDQEMAAAASNLITGQVDQELRTRYRQLPVRLRTAGLAATYAFIASKANGTDRLAAAYRSAAEGIRRRLVEQGLLAGDWRTMTARDVLDQLGHMDAAAYARASAEVAALTGWLSRLADAMYRRPADDGDGGDS
ncbi:type III-B CRISPR module-associated protein Cmr5 [Thermomonospora cellulosilytica]|uniref:CRISPR type III-B/RAMP module-associated protein Cmr5 n=1 Tax=Thermomonospora cellulosilytica TaxID=1411118 RepID=A0A7W3RBU8_9ACTN|nr:type III-B CRISPR module-associated protein Cmr5 [Thermomonospora cellulosilytica]MBA9007291.1 CRISPR type III-B/RAMP module-associated protein Cmr5 [Thermomonospora cellulosilytica]